MKKKARPGDTVCPLCCHRHHFSDVCGEGGDCQCPTPSKAKKVGETVDDLRERLAEAVSKLAYWHNSCADGDTFCGPCISGSPCATAAFLAKEKEKG